MSEILDSGRRTQFSTGAVRDIQENKGRCDLMPLDVIGELVRSAEGHHALFITISMFMETGDPLYLKCALDHFAALRKWDKPTMLLEVAKHFENGAKKYAENNWKLGINAKRYIDSAVRHGLKWMRGDTDEPHDRAFCWNILCCWWTCVHLPELNDYAPKEENGK